MMKKMQLNLVKLNNSNVVIEKETLTIDYNDLHNSYDKVRNELLELGQFRLRQKSGQWFMRLTTD